MAEANTKQANGNGAGPVIVAIVGILVIVGAAFVLVSGGVLNLGGNSGASFQTVDVSNPEAAAQSINEDIVEALGKGALSDPTKLLNVSEGSDYEGPVRFELQIETGSEDSGSAKIDFAGVVSPIEGGKYNLEGNGQIIGNISGLENLNATVDVLMVSDALYLKISNVPAEMLEGEAAYFALFIDKWIKMDTSAYTDIAAASAQLDPEELAAAQEELESNPLISNAKKADNRTVNGVNLTCMQADMDSSVFGAAGTEETTPVEICSDSGNSPLFIATSTNQGGVTTDYEFTMHGTSESVNIVAPTENVLDLNELFGGSGL